MYVILVTTMLSISVLCLCHKFLRDDAWFIFIFYTMQAICENMFGEWCTWNNLSFLEIKDSLLLKLIKGG